MELLERDEALAELHRQFARSATAGRLVVVSGEAGIGKTALVSRFLGECAPTPAVLWGGCDPLHTPRPLGPIRDAARGAVGELAGLLAEGSPRELVFDSVLDLLSRGPRRVLVVEDVHWADEASVDLLVWLGRRLDAMAGLILITYRHDDPAAGAISRVLGHAPARHVAHVPLEPLSPTAVARFASGSGRDPEQLHALTGGNPFFLTEVLAGPEAAVPATVREAVMARVEPLSSPARDVLELISIVPGRAELWLVGPSSGRDEALASGLLRSNVDGVSFRHELARLAVEASLPAHRRMGLNETVLARLADTDADPARLAHHAMEAGNTDAVAVHSAAAGRAAAAARAHREAARHFEAALAAGVPAGNAQAELLEAYADSAFRAYRADDALKARRAAVRAWAAVGNRSKAGENLRWQSRVASAAGLRTEAEQAAHSAIDVLESLPPGHELAMAYSNLSQLSCSPTMARPRWRGAGGPSSWAGSSATTKPGSMRSTTSARRDGCSARTTVRCCCGSRSGSPWMPAWMTTPAGPRSTSPTSTWSGAATTRPPTQSPPPSGSPTSESCSGSRNTCSRCARGSGSSRTTGTVRPRTPVRCCAAATSRASGRSRHW